MAGEEQLLEGRDRTNLSQFRTTLQKRNGKRLDLFTQTLCSGQHSAVVQLTLNSLFMKPIQSLTLRTGIAGMLVVAAVAFAFAAVKTTRPTIASSEPFILKKSSDPDLLEPGANKHARVGPNEYRNAAYTPEVEAYLIRSYPSDGVPTDASFNARLGWQTLVNGPSSSGTWTLRGASSTNFAPGILNSLGDNADENFSGRITSLAIGSSCTNASCVLYIGAAGGGIWKTTNALAQFPTYSFVSGSFGTNAIGSILIDPTDVTGNTVYVGTGEPNASGDSEAGVGVYKSTDGGATWALFPGTDIFFQRAIGQMQIDNSGKLLVPIASGVRGVSSVTSGASSSSATGHPLPTRGLYRCDGVSCTRIFTAPPPFTRGSSTCRVDPTHAGYIYVNAFGGNFFGPGTSGGIWRSTDNGASWAQIFAPIDASATATGSALERDEFDVTTLPGGATRMYVNAGAYPPGGASVSHFFVSDNADTAASFASMGGAQIANSCTSQCWYDNPVYTPAGHPNTVYVGGSFDYNNIVASGHGSTNGRAVLLSTDGGGTWHDLTQDASTPHAKYIHPDQHAIATSPANQFILFEGCDGGLFRTDGQFADVSAKCDSRGLDASDTAFCKSLLSMVPHRLSDVNKGLSTLQFQSVSVSAQDPLNTLQGGTQDNGTWSFGASTANIKMEIYGDGGNSGFSASTASRRVNTFTGQASDVNFRNGNPAAWVIGTGPIVSSAEASYFYPPVLADPKKAGTIFQGSFSIWRTQDWAGSQAFLEANCPEFTTSAADPSCGDFVPLGGPASGSGSDSGDLTGTFYGSSRTGGAVAWIARAPQDSSTMWAATGTGRLFISENADAAAASVTYTRLDPAGSSTNDPGRAISDIFVDPTNAHHVWVSYNGYNVNTPSQPGHVFDVTTDGTTAVFTDISYNLPDFPITALVEDSNGDLYAGSDFGVMKLPFGTTTWVVAGSGLPMVEVANLTINTGARVLYAATHGRSVWVMTLP